jgi:molybdate transport repressor ModE-like protein
LTGVVIEVGWRFEFGHETRVADPVLFALLRGIARDGRLKSAAGTARVSYRHAWGLIRDWEDRFGVRLVSLQRGRGASLTAAGTALLDAEKTARETLRPALETASSKATRQLRRALGARAPSPIRIASSHGLRMLDIRDQLADTGQTVKLDIVGSETALSRYDGREADVVGFHLPLGVLARGVASGLLARLSDDRDDVRLIEKRRLGLMSRPERPCRNIEQLCSERMRFINRQAGSGTRLVLDALLASIDEEHTHTAVAALIASGAADVGFGTEAAAREFKLTFEPLAAEHFYLAFRKDAHAELRARIDEFCRPPESTNGKDGSPTAGQDGQWTVRALRRLHGVANRSTSR